MKKKFGAVIAAVICIVMVLSLAACGGGRSATTLELTNGLAYDFDHVFIAPHSDTEWGDDLLAENEDIVTGTSHTFTLGSASDDAWDICCVDTDGDYWYFYNVTIKGENAATVQSGPVLTFTNGTSVDGTFEFGSLGSLVDGLTDTIETLGDAVESGVEDVVEDVNAALGGGEVFTAHYLLTNIGSADLYWYFSTDTDSDSWGEDRLDGAILHSDESMMLDIPSTSANTSFDVRVMFDEGPYYAAAGIDFSNVEAVTVNSDTLTLELFDDTLSSIGTVTLVEN